MPAAGRQQNLGSQPGRGKQNRGSHSDCEMPDSKSVLERQRAGAGAAQGTWWSFSVTSSALGPQLGRTCQPLTGPQECCTLERSQQPGAERCKFHRIKGWNTSWFPQDDANGQESTETHFKGRSSNCSGYILQRAQAGHMKENYEITE